MYFAQATQFVGYLPNVDDVTPDDSLGLDDMFEVVRKACEDYEGLQAKKEKKKAKIEELRAKQQLLSPIPSARLRPAQGPWISLYHLSFRTDRAGILSQDE